MKNKTLRIGVLILLLFSLSACSTVNPIEENQFNITFSQMNFKENTADFVIYGYPNEEEQDEIIQVVKDSLEGQNISEETTVNLYSDLQEESQEPFYGTLTYKDKEVEGNINMPTEDEYIQIASI